MRTDPAPKLARGRLPETGADLASQPTLSRLENAVDAAACERLAAALLALYLRERERDGVPTHSVVDVDSTDDPAHGKQEGTAYHGYYRQHMDHPLLLFDGTTDHLIAAVLRPGNAHASAEVVPALERVVGAMRARWPAAAIDVRSDSGCAVPAIYEFCDRARIGYTIGLVPNSRLAAPAAPLLGQAQRRRAAAAAEKVRLVGEATYRAASWPRERRVVIKAEALARGPNTRFVVTSRDDPPQARYDWSVDRGEAEGWIKDLKRACVADRLSDHRFLANRFRLLLHAAAYWLLDTLRRWLQRRAVPRMQLDTLRLHLLKIGGRVWQLTDRVRLRLASSHPGQPLWALLARDRGLHE